MGTRPRARGRPSASRSSPAGGGRHAAQGRSEARPRRAPRLPSPGVCAAGSVRLGRALRARSREGRRTVGSENLPGGAVPFSRLPRAARLAPRGRRGAAGRGLGARRRLLPRRSSGSGIPSPAGHVTRELRRGASPPRWLGKDADRRRQLTGSEGKAEDAPEPWELEACPFREGNRSQPFITSGGRTEVDSD